MGVPPNHGRPVTRREIALNACPWSSRVGALTWWRAVAATGAAGLRNRRASLPVAPATPTPGTLPAWRHITPIAVSYLYASLLDDYQCFAHAALCLPDPRGFSVAFHGKPLDEARGNYLGQRDEQPARGLGVEQQVAPHARHGIAKPDPPVEGVAVGGPPTRRSAGRAELPRRG